MKGREYRHTLKQQANDAYSELHHNQGKLSRKPSYSAMHNPDGSLTNIGRRWLEQHREESNEDVDHES